MALHAVIGDLHALDEMRVAATIIEGAPFVVERQVLVQFVMASRLAPRVLPDVGDGGRGFMDIVLVPFFASLTAAQAPFFRI